RRRCAAERLPASPTASRIDIASSRPIDVSEIWKDSSQFWRLLCLFERATFAVSGYPGQNPGRGTPMSRIPTPATIDAAPAASRPLLEAVKKQLGLVPNMFRLVANSPAALEGYLGLSGALNKGTLPAPTRERIALAVAEINGCNYCLSAHTYLVKNLARLAE